MKKLIIVAILLLPGITFASFDRNLSYGMSGTDVADLQDILNTEGCFTNVTTGYFGPLTLEGVKCFQLKKAVPSTGYVGSLTRVALNNILSGLTESSNQAEIAETGTTITPVICPIGYTCAPIKQINPPVATPTPVIVPIPMVVPTPALGLATSTPAPVTPSTISLESQVCIGHQSMVNNSLFTDIRPMIYIRTTGRTPDAYRALFTTESGEVRYNAEPITDGKLYPDIGRYNYVVTSYQSVSEAIPYTSETRMVRKQLAEVRGNVEVRGCGSKADVIIPLPLQNGGGSRPGSANS